MPTWGAVTYGVVLSGVLAAVALLFVVRERRAAVIATSAGDFFVDAPGVVFPISFEDTGSGVFTAALAALALGFGPLQTGTGRRLAATATICGLAALLVDIYLY